MKTRIKIDSALLSFAIILTGLLYQFPQVYSSSRALDNIWDFTGMIFILKGTMIRMVARGHKKSNSKDGKELVMSGIYRLTRNPMYLGSFYMGTGFVLIVWPWWSVFFFAALFYMRFRRQVLIEEAFLKQEFGRQYEEYCSKVARVFPHLRQLGQIKRGEIVNFEEAFSTKEKYGLLGWPVLAIFLETLQENVVFHSTSIEWTVTIFAVAALLYAGILFIRVERSKA